MVAHPFVIVPIETLVAAIAALELFVGHMALESHTRHHEVICAQQLLHFLGDVSVETADRCTHYHDRRDADDDANQREKGPQLVRQDRLQRTPRSIGVKRKDVTHDFLGRVFFSTTAQPKKFVKKTAAECSAMKTLRPGELLTSAEARP